MRLISFAKFKSACKHVKWNDVTFERDLCLNGFNEEREVMTIENRVYSYSPCKEKHCPILQKCKEANK